MARSPAKTASKKGAGRSKSPARKKSPARSKKSASKKGNGGGGRDDFDNVVVCEDNERPADVADVLGVDVSVLLAANRAKYPGIKANSRLQAGTELIIPKGWDLSKPSAATSSPVKKKRGGGRSKSPKPKPKKKATPKPKKKSPKPKPKPKAKAKRSPPRKRSPSPAAKKKRCSLM